jgi:predicted metalloprotease with PDZ domain
MCVFGSVAQNLPTMNVAIDVAANLDTIYVRLTPSAHLPKHASIYQFAATAPGTYQTMNIGRYVSYFKAFDNKGNALDVKRLSVNQFEIDKPNKIDYISYAVAETFDTKLPELPIYLMCGSSVEDDHVLLNAHTFLGYFDGLQSSPISLKVKANAAWQSGSAMKMVNGAYQAESYDHIVDSPILMGKLTKADTVIGTTPIEIYCYSKNNQITAAGLLKGMGDMLGAAKLFLVELPVDHYTFLYHFEPTPPGVTGAWEHSYSSEYVLAEGEPTAIYLDKVVDIASHEFFHIVTPLNIHSEIIEKFNFVSPTPSQHLWLYEGVTEWASNVLLYRGGVLSLDEYLSGSVARKITIDSKHFDATWSLKRIADESFTTGAAQYGNIYYRGSLVAGLLDIRLLELSKGTYGLRELMLDLVKKYGKGKPVSETGLFDEITKMTYPEIRTFFDDYVLDSKPLPMESYFAKIGITVNQGRKGLVVEKKTKMTDEQKMLFEAWSKNLPRK